MFIRQEMPQRKKETENYLIARPMQLLDNCSDAFAFCCSLSLFIFILFLFECEQVSRNTDERFVKNEIYTYIQIHTNTYIYDTSV